MTQQCCKVIGCRIIFSVIRMLSACLISTPTMSHCLARNIRSLIPGYGCVMAVGYTDPAGDTRHNSSKIIRHILDSLIVRGLDGNQRRRIPAKSYFRYDGTHARSLRKLMGGFILQDVPFSSSTRTSCWPWIPLAVKSARVPGQYNGSVDFAPANNSYREAECLHIMAPEPLVLQTRVVQSLVACSAARTCGSLILLVRIRAANSISRLAA